MWGVHAGLMEGVMGDNGSQQRGRERTEQKGERETTTHTDRGGGKRDGERGGKERCQEMWGRGTQDRHVGWFQLLMINLLPIREKRLQH